RRLSITCAPATSRTEVAVIDESGASAMAVITDSLRLKGFTAGFDMVGMWPSEKGMAAMSLGQVLSTPCRHPPGTADGRTLRCTAGPSARYLWALYRCNAS